VLEGAGDPVGAAGEAAQHRQQRGQLVAGRLPQGGGLQLAGELGGGERPRFGDDVEAGASSARVASRVASARNTAATSGGTMSW